MKKVLIVLVGLLAVSAYAADMDVFFSADNAIAPKTPAPLDLGQVAPGSSQTVYIYAQVNLYENPWNGFGLRLDQSGATWDNGQLYNPNMGGTDTKHPKAFRWQNGSVAGGDPTNPIGPDADGDLNGIFVSANFSLLGIGALPSAGDYAGDPIDDSSDTMAYSQFFGAGDWIGTYLVGEITLHFTADGGLDAGVSNDWFTRQGDPGPDWATVRFGGQGPDLDGRVTNNGLDGSYNDVTWTVPEPTSLLLLAVGALAFRRR
jgi:hypothetical protein